MKNQSLKDNVHKKGFALIVTMTLLLLLAVIVVSYLSLSMVTLRSSGQNENLAVAQSNARMALALAIGELQKQAGLDTRVTARADILDEDNPMVTGVWRSWEGEDHDANANGRPISPGNYEQKKTDHFQGWLVSEADKMLIPDTTPGVGKASLVGSHTVGSGADREELQIHLDPIDFTSAGQDGSYAWWVGGENQKAHLPTPVEPKSDDQAGWAMNLKSHAVADPSVFGLDSVLDDPTLGQRAITRNMGNLFATAGARPFSEEHFHDLSATSTGLLTNVATGGWRKDLSLLTERWDDISKNDLPMFGLTPQQKNEVDLPTSGNVRADKSIFYPWSSYRGSSGLWPIYQHGAVASWANLKDYAMMYTRVNAGNTGRASIDAYSSGSQDAGNLYNFMHKVRILPIVARVQWLYSHSASRAQAPEGQTGIYYKAQLILNPVVTMWNPYNVELRFNNFPLDFNIPKPLPTALKYTVGTVEQQNFHSITAGSQNYGVPLENVGNLSYKINSGFVLQPGETRVFSPASNFPQAAGQTLTLTPGYRPRGGHSFVVKGDDGQPILGTGDTEFSVQVNFDTAYNDGQENVGLPPGVGIYMDMSYAGQLRLAYRMVYESSVAEQIYPPMSNFATSKMVEAASSPKPFLTTIFGARMASQSHLASKGLVQSSPLVNYTAMGGKDKVESTIGRHYFGTNHPVNSPFDYSFSKITGGGSDLTPGVNNTNNRGYIMTGFKSGDGLSRAVIAELPTRPLQSLGELQHWDLRYENPIPPYAFNLIGNSDATPLLPANAVVNSGDKFAANLQYDDSYSANHLLFDDWFFSSIAPNPAAFGDNGGTDLRDTYINFVKQSKPLPNQSYLPIWEDVSQAKISNGEATQLYTENIDQDDSWQTIASRLEVEGMFNVNSTSVKAWRALLGHARGQKVPYLTESGGGWDVDLSGESDYAFSRFSIAADTEASKLGISGTFPKATEFVGYRILEEDSLDALAAEIVDQIRERGPFLSLSEFVNRQLSSGDLALAGAVQAALNELEKSALNPYAGMDGNSVMASKTPVASSDTEYQFPDAAVGRNVYGLPGWTRQADILRPLAPILSARDDTFVVRAYGDAKDSDGKIIASATCEAIVSRQRDYVDASDDADVTTQPASVMNQTFGRRFKVVSFRWLSSDEI